MFAQVVDIFKLRIGVFMALTALAGYAVTPGLKLDSVHMLLLALVVFGASAAAGAFNQFMERDLDARMPRTKNRPFVDRHSIDGIKCPADPIALGHAVRRGPF